MHRRAHAAVLALVATACLPDTRGAVTYQKTPGPGAPLAEFKYDILSDPIRNPERGFVQAIDIFDEGDVNYVAGLGVSLGLARIRLDSFIKSDVPGTFTHKLEKGFERSRAAGLKLVVRFQYNAGDAIDADLGTIERHIAALRPVLERNQDLILAVQAGFIGAWGEWHGTELASSPEARTKILEELLEGLPESQILVRSPLFKAEALRSLPETLQSAAADRIGYHNDCLLAGSGDRGTYPEPEDEWRAYVRADRIGLIIGGETCAPNPPQTHCGTTVSELRKYRWTFLNRSYHPDVVDTWEQQGCLPLLARDLGYRIALLRSSRPETGSPGQTLPIQLELENLGYASPTRSRHAYLVITGQGQTWTQRTDLDVAILSPNGARPHDLQLQIPPHLPTGTYQIELWLPDPSARLRDDPRYALRLSNESIWNPKTGRHALGTLRIESPTNDHDSA